MAEVSNPHIMKTSERSFLLLKKKTHPSKNIRSALIKISTPNTKPELDPACYLEEVHRINNGRYGVTIRRGYPYIANHLEDK